MVRSAASRNKSNNIEIVSNVPRWGALTFHEEVENDMIANRVKDIFARPHRTNYLKINASRFSRAAADGIAKLIRQ